MVKIEKHKILHPSLSEYTFFSVDHGTFLKEIIF